MAAYGRSIHPTSSIGESVARPSSLIPHGPCSYRDLSAGFKAPTCGCQRFWLNNSNVVAQDSERAWCFCGHHACFHEVDARPQTAGPSWPYPSQGHLGVDGIGDETSPQRSVAAGPDVPDGGLTPTLERAPSTDQQQPAGLGIRNTSSSQSQSINTRLWQALNGFARAQEDGRHSGDTSKLPSTAVPSVIDEPRAHVASAGSDENDRLRAMGPPVTIPTTHPFVPRTEEYSATEIATPSMKGTPDFNQPAAPGTHMEPPPNEFTAGRTYRPSPRHVLHEVGHARRAGSPLMEQAGHPVMSAQEIRNTIQNYGRRLSVLENFSFSHMPSDEVVGRFDLAESRLLDLEHWRMDVEKDINHAAATTSMDWTPEMRRRLALPDDDVDSVGSDGSFDSNAAAHTEAVVLATLAANAEVGPRMEALECRIETLERAALPSFTRPWHVQVVLLPFGRHLPGVWFSSLQSTRHSQKSASRGSEEWTGPQNSLHLSFTGSTTGTWTTDSIRAWASETQDDWLSPKACGPRGTVFQRLQSRGLVRDLIFEAPDARHIFGVIANAFGSVLGHPDPIASRPSEEFFGLKEPFLPLRKVRKSSRLRFLGPAEMVTSATWNAEFLESSVFMRVDDGQRRLYITTPDAYLQNSDLGWTWSSIRDLPEHDLTAHALRPHLRGVALEACWTYNDQLDHVPSLHSSFATHASLWSAHSPSSNRPDHERAEPGPSRVFGTGHASGRSVSLPSSTSTHLPLSGTAVPKRRVASFETVELAAAARRAGVLSSSPEDDEHPSHKRRRISSLFAERLEHRGVNFTPVTSHRFSLSRDEPLSPPPPGSNAFAGRGFPPALAAPLSQPLPLHEQQQQQHQAGTIAARKPRGNTPFAYATPHSNSNLDSSRLGDPADTEPFSPDAAALSDRAEDEWDGVQDGPVSPVRSERFDDDDQDEDDDEQDDDGGQMAVYL